MNRAERRKKGNKEKVKTYTLTDTQIAELEKKIKGKLVKEIEPKTLALTLLALRDGFGFGGKRLERFIDEYKKLYDFYNEDMFELEDVLDILNKETGLKIEVKK